MTTPPAPAVPASPGVRFAPLVDFATADWVRNEHGVDVLILSSDPMSGALTLALRTPDGMQYPEREHYYDCDQDLFQFEGEFHHDEELPFFAGDYVWRPAGTVYGHSEGSSGGVIVASLGRRPARHHYDEYPAPWTGHHRVDRAWHDRPDPFVVRAGEWRWGSGPVAGTSLARLRGTPGEFASHGGKSSHSPSAAEAVFILRIEAGFSGEFPVWKGFALETLVLRGEASCANRTWRRGCYAFNGIRGATEVSETLLIYCRCLSI